MRVYIAIPLKKNSSIAIRLSPTPLFLEFYPYHRLYHLLCNDLFLVKTYVDRILSSQANSTAKLNS